LPGVEALTTGLGLRYLSLDAGHHCFGHCQHNYAITQAKGDYIHLNDDDDIWTPDAVSLMRRGAQTWPGKVLLFRFQSYYGRQIFWSQAGRLERDTIGGHCVVTPNVPGKIGKFTDAYNGDFDYIEGTVNGFGNDPIWINAIVAIARP